MGTGLMAMAAGLASFACGVVLVVLLFMDATIVEWAQGTIGLLRSVGTTLLRLAVCRVSLM